MALGFAAQMFCASRWLKLLLCQRWLRVHDFSLQAGAKSFGNPSSSEVYGRKNKSKHEMPGRLVLMQGLTHAA